MGKLQVFFCNGPTIRLTNLLKNDKRKTINVLLSRFTQKTISYILKFRETCNNSIYWILDFDCHFFALCHQLRHFIAIFCPSPCHYIAISLLFAPLYAICLPFPFRLPALCYFLRFCPSPFFATPITFLYPLHSALCHLPIFIVLLGHFFPPLFRHFHSSIATESQKRSQCCCCRRWCCCCCRWCCCE